jgi:DNA-binding CsgD family transcriptional regulator
MVAEGIAAALARDPMIVSLPAVTTAEQAMLLANRADAAALDASLPDVDRAALFLRRHGVRVVMLGAEGVGEDEDTGITVSLDSRISALAQALVPDHVAVDPAGVRLTRRQREILELVSRGLAAKEVARSLGISPKTVEQHKTRMFARLGVPNQAAAVRMALTSGREGSA